ncbi:hypothetical protein L9F63_004123, partial [Diploptera punctata]
MPNDEKLKALLSDLGRATLRGVRKCPKCGTYNGTRGLICKNRACDVVFKEGGEKRKMSTEACKLITGTTTQVFSVRVRDKGPDYRGFVQLPVHQTSDSLDPLDTEAALISQTSALCFVDTCQMSFDDEVEEQHEEKTTPAPPTTCQHIQAALRCYAEAQPLPLKNCVLSSLSVSNDMKQAIWMLATEATGPLVQRVSKNIMAVKCKASPKHPLGYLHFSFFMSRLKDRVENKYFCSCTAFKGQGKHSSNKEDPPFKFCVHFYACICAFASDSKLSEEFAYYINLDKPALTLSPTPATEQPHLVAILSDEDVTGCEVEVEVLREEAALLEATGITVTDDVTIAQVHGLEVLSTEHVEVQIQGIDTETLNFNEPILPETVQDLQPAQHMEALSVKRKREDHSRVAPLQEVGTKKSSSARKNNSIIGLRKEETVDEKQASLTFIQWLASVTERINQTMHFQFSGKPDPLVFHVPQVFFDCLRERISCGGKKKRLPNMTTAFVRRDAVPLGTFTKYTWHITNILQVKQIFETPLMPLEITRSFVENHDGTYEPYQRCKDENEAFRKTEGQPLIKPLELKTFLKVGNMSPDQQDPTPFFIEWIPDILPCSKIGELRIRFEFGHSRNGHSDKKCQRALSDAQEK